MAVDDKFLTETKRALETLSLVSDLSQYEVKNTLGVNDSGQSFDEPGYEFFYEKKKIGFSDFLPQDGSVVTINEGFGTEESMNIDSFYVPEFANLYKADYDKAKEQLNLAGVDLSLTEYNQLLLEGAYISYEKEYGWDQFLSDILSVTIIYPVLTGIFEYDPALGRPLSQSESKSNIISGSIQGVLAVVTFGTAPAGLTLLQKLAYVGTNIGVGMLGEGTRSLSEQALLEFGVDPQIASLVSAGLGIGVAYKVGKYNHGKWVELGQQNIINALALEKTSLIEEVISNGEKISADKVIDIRRLSDGRIVWLEEGSANAGYKHILKHSGEFSQLGILEEQIPDFLFEVLENSNQVGTIKTGNATPRPVYLGNYNGQDIYIGITVGSNGFIVSAQIVGADKIIFN